MDATPDTVGVIVGRFQVPRLHHGHRALIEFVRYRSAQTLVLLGTPQFPTSRNPLSYEMRREMVLEAYPDVRIEPLEDHPSDEIWVENLETRIASLFPSSASDITLYGSRDSFLGMYTGRYPTTHVDEVQCTSGTEHRRIVGMHTETSEGIRSGIIRTYENLFPTVHSTVDIALVRPDCNKVLLGRKKSEDRATEASNWRFIGGRVDREDRSAKHAARRELHEEAGACTVGALQYIGSRKIDDWRYRGSKDGILTSFFYAEYLSGEVAAHDDINEVRWFSVHQITDVIIEDHAPLGHMLLRWLASNEQAYR